MLDAIHQQENAGNLFLLCATTASSLRGLYARLVSLDLGATATLQHSHHTTTTSLEWSLQISTSRLSEQMDLDKVVLEGAFKRDDALKSSLTLPLFCLPIWVTIRIEKTHT